MTRSLARSRFSSRLTGSPTAAAVPIGLVDEPGSLSRSTCARSRRQAEMTRIAVALANHVLGVDGFFEWTSERS